ncbi:prolipoprotein diacylglyceryl transferase [Foetidibacter luteolus]|uniref:prolipoprotein diacylglyceryl transferase n=1 Tax=Foetidibacter luteolus TaxID=2608880 RepID=UPI00129A612C|nr:prolipoprotein diacylglyceryl transferase family protein [Foetidibacter luteolus]
MYPNLYYLFKDLFGISLPALKIVNSFGFFVAVSFLISAWVLVKELRRKQAEGLLTYSDSVVTVGEPASAGEMLLNFILGFILGYKILGVFIIKGALDNPQAFIFSGRGSLPAALVLGGLFAWLKWREKNKVKLAKPEKRTIRLWPSDRVGDVVIIAAASGFIGAKIFDNLENWDRFIQNPVGNLLSPSGLTYYGGLICATIALGYYFKKHKIPYVHICDAAAPVLLLAYGLGRIGCQVAGDGDWGIVNSAYVSDAAGKVSPAAPGQFQAALQSNTTFYLQQFGSVNNVHHKPFSGFAGLPDWFFAYTYPNNVNGEGVAIPGCDWGEYCNRLPLPVYPTPLYEIIMCLLLFALVWALRKKIKVPGRIFAVYLILNGLERFFIEKIRVNTTYNLFGFHPTQAEIISTLLVVAGIALYAYAPKIKTPVYESLESK